MTAAVWVALIAAMTALVTSLISLVGQRRTAALQHELASRRDDVTRAADLQRVMTKFRQPLLQAATDLQSRLFNIVRGRLLQIYGRGKPDEQRYTVESTLFVFAEYFGWVEALRRDVQYLDLGGDAANRKVQECLERIAFELLRDDLEPELRLFRGQQRALGEIMLAPRSGSGGLECIGFATFSVRLSEQEFARWFAKLRADIDSLSQRQSVSSSRIERLQGALIDLIDTLDPSAIRVPATRRSKLVAESPASALNAAADERSMEARFARID